MPNPFVYAELHTTDPSAAKAFYRRLFDWKLSDSETPSGTYTEIHPGDGPEAGLMAATPIDGGRSFWQPYIRVSDLDAATAKAQELGATLRAPRTEVPGMGWLTVLDDPTGARFALWEKNPAQK